MRTELKKNCISIITGQHYSAFNSILPSPYGPQINLYEAEAEGEYVKFFEQAFEWENMSKSKSSVPALNRCSQFCWFMTL